MISDFQNKKILLVSPHPDDIEIFMYGLLSIYHDRGDQIFLAIATDGSAGGKQKGLELSILRKKETIKALSNFPEPTFFNSQENSPASKDFSHSEMATRLPF